MRIQVMLCKEVAVPHAGGGFSGRPHAPGPLTFSNSQSACLESHVHSWGWPICRGTRDGGINVTTFNLHLVDRSRSPNAHASTLAALRRGLRPQASSNIFSHLSVPAANACGELHELRAVGSWASEPEPAEPEWDVNTCKHLQAPKPC